MIFWDTFLKGSKTLGTNNVSSCFFTFKGFDVDRPKPGKLWTLYLGEIYNVTMSCVSSLATSLPGLTACHHPQTKANKTTHGHGQGEEHPHLRTGGAPQRGSQRGPPKGPPKPRRPCALGIRVGVGGQVDRCRSSEVQSIDLSSRKPQVFWDRFQRQELFEFSRKAH